MRRAAGKGATGRRPVRLRSHGANPRRRAAVKPRRREFYFLPPIVAVQPFVSALLSGIPIVGASATS